MLLGHSGALAVLFCPSILLSNDNFFFYLVGGFLFSSSFDKTIHVWSLQVQTLEAQFLKFQVLLLVQFVENHV